jgi:uracil-xanthine permease
MKRPIWTLHGDGANVTAGAAVAPDERLSWPRTIGIGAQHVLAMFGATVAVPAITGLPPTATLFFSGIGTFLFLLITKNRVPSYLGSSFAFLAPLAAAGVVAGDDLTAEAIARGLGGIVFAGVLLAIVGLVVNVVGTRWIEVLMPPVVTGSIVALIGINLAPVATGQFATSHLTAVVTLLAAVTAMVAFKGFVARVSIVFAAVVGGLVAWLRGEWDFSRVGDAAWFGLPDFATPTFDTAVLIPFIPVVLVLIAENIGHLKTVAAMTGKNIDDMTGRALFADGLATTIAGSGGGAGTTTYAENIGVMAATRVYSTLAYWVAGAVAILLAFSPKFGALISAIPVGVLGGLTVLLFGLIVILGARIWVQNKVDFTHPVNLATAAVALIVGAGNLTWTAGDWSFGGIALGTAATLIIFHGMSALAKWRGTHPAPLSVATVPEDVAAATDAAATSASTAKKRAPKQK